jgi:hypothetical protein
VAAYKHSLLHNNQGEERNNNMNNRIPVIETVGRASELIQLKPSVSIYGFGSSAHTKQIMPVSLELAE